MKFIIAQTFTFSSMNSISRLRKRNSAKFRVILVLPFMRDYSFHRCSSKQDSSNGDKIRDENESDIMKIIGEYRETFSEISRR